MRKLKVNLEEIADVMETQNRFDQNYYLDKESGEVVIIPGEVMSVVEGEREMDDLPDWEKQLVEVAKDVDSNPERYEYIPEKPSYEGYNLMMEFAEGVKNEQLQEKLAIALKGKGAFRRFKDVLLNYPDYREEWFNFEQEHLNNEVIEWLNSIDIEPPGKTCET